MAKCLVIMSFYDVSWARPYVLLIISLTSARNMVSGCEDRKICLAELYLQITASRDWQLMESALDVHISVSNNIASIVANVCSILVPRYCSDDYTPFRRPHSTALKGIRTPARDHRGPSLL